MSRGVTCRRGRFALACVLVGTLITGCGHSDDDRYSEWRTQYQEIMQGWFPSQAEMEKQLGVKVRKVKLSEGNFAINQGNINTAGSLLVWSDILAEELDIPTPRVQMSYFLEGYEDARIIIVVGATKTPGYDDEWPILRNADLWPSQCGYSVETPEERGNGTPAGGAFCRPMEDLPDRYIGYIEGGEDPTWDEKYPDVFRDEFIVTTVEPSWVIAVSWLNLGEDVPLDIDLLSLMEDVEASVVKNKHVIENRIHKEATIPTNTPSTEPTPIPATAATPAS